MVVLCKKTHLNPSDDGSRKSEQEFSSFQNEACPLEFLKLLPNTCVVNKDSPFLQKISLKVGARVMLTYNVDVCDHLTNGTTGTVMGIIKNISGLVSTVMIGFDDIKVGEKMKLSYPALCSKYPGAVPISKLRYSYRIGNARKAHTTKATVFQFPIRLSWAITSHKVKIILFEFELKFLLWFQCKRIQLCYILTILIAKTLLNCPTVLYTLNMARSVL